VFRFVFVCNVFWVEFQQRLLLGWWLLLLLWGWWMLLLLGWWWWREGGRVSLGVIMTNTEIKFHILLFTLH
jgi:hypothetical protein